MWAAERSGPWPLMLAGASFGLAVPSRLEGIVGVDAGRLGQPVFGPMALLRGETVGREF